MHCDKTAPRMKFECKLILNVDSLHIKIIIHIQLKLFHTMKGGNNNC